MQGWHDFYFMIGSSSAGLIGLLFVVVTLTSGADPAQAQRGQALYLTPSVVHFAIVLCVSAIAVAPGLGPAQTAALIGVAAVVGLARAVRSSIGINRPRSGMPTPHWSDVWMYGVMPAVIYVGIGGAAAALWARAPGAAFATAVLLLALMLVGIRNAWDLVTWIAPTRGARGS